MLIRNVLAELRTEADIREVSSRLDDALVGHEGLAVQVIAADGKTFYAKGDLSYSREVLGSLLGASSPLVSWEDRGHDWRGIAKVDTVAGRPFTVVVALDMAEHMDFMIAFRHTLWAAVAFAIVVTSLLGWLAARRGLAPLHAIAGVARDVSAERLNQRLPIERVPAELQDLVAAFNDMLSRLEDSFRRLSEFSSDIAHELRTPVSNLMTQTQVAVSKTRTAEEYREVLYSNLEEYDRLARMIADMLFIAKTDNGLLVPSREAVMLGNEIDQLIDFYQALADEQGVTMTCRGDGRVAGDPLMLRRAISNLLSNAIRHTPRGGSVSIKVESLPADRVRICVENTGEAIAAEHLSRLFERFYRVDASRQRGNEGAGLGLAIVKSIVDAHGGEISVTSECGITSFTMTLPAA
jgi:two-component system heavy metal sensor histidine kinase CusS